MQEFGFGLEACSDYEEGCETGVVWEELQPKLKPVKEFIQ
jgi:hypothetical protein